jgi:hypothetical protein
MNNTHGNTQLKYSTYGSGKAIIEILNIGFEPLLTEEEYAVYKEIGLLKQNVSNIKNTISFIECKMMYLDIDDCYYSWLNKRLCDLDEAKYLVEEDIKSKNKLFKALLDDNVSITRTICDNRDFRDEDQFRNIAIFESDLTRCFGCNDMEHSDDIVSVVTYYTPIFNSIIHNGFNYKGKHYVFFTAGAGQTRCKKSTFVSEDKLNENANRLFCGLTREKINEQGGCNTNKYLAYTSLCQTNSEIWTNFDIDRAIVVEDIEYEIPDQDVRYIYTESPEDKEYLKSLRDDLDSISDELKEIRDKKKNIPKGQRRLSTEVAHEKKLRERKNQLLQEIKDLQSKYHQTSLRKMGVNIPFTDGFGISLKKMQSSMIRLPFIKGLIAYCPKRAFQDWCSENGVAIHKVTDIYGKSYSITEIDYIFTKSQFKMWKYYNNEYDENNNLIRTGWEVYKDNFKKYNCDACRCNVENNVKLNAKTNYQVLQTLTTEMTDDDILEMASYDINCLNGIGRNVQCMLNVLGANEKRNNNLNWLQKSLILYPEMLKDFYVKTLLKNTKNSMIKKFRSGKFNINGSYVFAIPDTLACLQWWFTDIDKSNVKNFGFVKEGHISCNLFEDKEELDCLRSPHLDHAHCIRKNQITKNDTRWLKSNGVYIGMFDTMSKLLVYDNDGDRLLIHNNKTIIKCAKQFQSKYGMIPNYYDMPKANPEIITNTSLFEGIVNAYHHGNIGTPSNEITKVWATLNPQSDKAEIEKAIDIVSLRCVDVNFTIDYAKTLYKPEISKQISNKYKEFSGKKVPHFFVYAKNKKARQVEDVGQCNIDRISYVVKNNRIVFKDLLGKYSYKMLMNDPDVDYKTDKAEEILALYRELENANLRKLSHVDFTILNNYEKKRALLQIEFDTNKQRKMFVDIINEPKEYIADVLIKLLQDDINKDTLWRLFGEVIYNNLEKNLKNTKICQDCNSRFEYIHKQGKPPMFCESCASKRETEMSKKRMKKHRIAVNIA